MKKFILYVSLITPCVLSACSDESTTEVDTTDVDDIAAINDHPTRPTPHPPTTSDTEPDSDQAFAKRLTRASSMSDLIKGLDIKDAETRSFCAANIARKVYDKGERPPTAKLIERMNDPAEVPDIRWSCAISVYYITNDKSLVRQTMLDIFAAGSVRPGGFIQHELGVTLEEAMPYIEKFRDHSESSNLIAEELIEHWGDPPKKPYQRR